MGTYAATQRSGYPVNWCKSEVRLAGFGDRVGPVPSRNTSSACHPHLFYRRAWTLSGRHGHSTKIIYNKGFLD